MFQIMKMRLMEEIYEKEYKNQNDFFVAMGIHYTSFCVWRG